MSVRTDILFKTLKLSYSTYNLMKCPIKYYVLKFLGIDNSSGYATLGIIIHRAYEILTKVLLNQKDEFLFSFSEKKVKKLWNYSFVQAKSEILKSSFGTDCEREILEKEPELNEIFKELKELEENYLPPVAFSKYILSKLSDDYDVDVESECSVSIEKFDFFNIPELYIRPDILIKSKDGKNVEIIDIKTSRKVNQVSHIEQLVFYGYALSLKNPEIEKISSSIFYARYGEFKTVFKNITTEKLESEFEKILNKMNSFYKELNIKDRDTLKKFVNGLQSFGNDDFYKVKISLFKNYGNVCGTCPIANCCPVKNSEISLVDFVKVIKGENISDVVCSTSSYNRQVQDVIGYFVSPTNNE